MFQIFIVFSIIWLVFESQKLCRAGQNLVEAREYPDTCVNSMQFENYKKEFYWTIFLIPEHIFLENQTNLLVPHSYSYQYDGKQREMLTYFSTSVVQRSLGNREFNFRNNRFVHSDHIRQIQ